MELFANLATGFGAAVTPVNLGFCLFGCLIGTLIGVLPGIGPIATIAMLLPVTFGLSPLGALIMLAGIYYGAQYGGSTTAILVNLPGESSSVVTCIDGYQMARNGRAGAALADRGRRLVLRGLRRHHPHRGIRAGAGRIRGQVPLAGIFRADAVRPDRRGRSRARLGGEGGRHGHSRLAGRPGRHRIAERAPRVSPSA